MLELRWFRNIVLGVTALGFTVAGWYSIDSQRGAPPRSAVAMVPPQTSGVAPAVLAQTPAVTPATTAQPPTAATPTVALSAISLCDPMAAVDNVAALTVVSPGTIEGRVLPETAPGGTVVLRGNHTANPDDPRASAGPTGRPIGNEPAAPRSLQAGWDRNYNTTGIDWSEYDAAGIDRSADRIYDTSGFDRNFDLSGLSRPIR
jgi:hypothetical protein